jgi:vitamin B12 transporter
MRGTNSNHTKVLVDSIDVSDPSTPNGAVDFAHLLAADIQQLEVLRGPQSGLYGSDAIGGVISIVTQKGDGSPRATASIETGSFKTFNQTAGLSGSQDNFNYALNVAHLHAGDIPVTPLELMPPGQKANANNYDNMTYSTKLGADINEYWSVNSVVRYTDATLLFTGDSGFPSTPNPAQSTHAVQQFFTREEAVSSLLDGRIKNYFAVNYANNRSSDIAPGDPVATGTTGERIKYDWHSVTELARGNNLIIGAEQQTDRMDTTGFSAANGNKAGFVELQSEFAKRFFLVVNIRDDFNDQFGEHATYRIAPAVIIPFTETKLKASYGTGFKAPTLSELFQNFPDFGFFGNPNLKPEQSGGYAPASSSPCSTTGGGSGRPTSITASLTSSPPTTPSPLTRRKSRNDRGQRKLRFGEDNGPRRSPRRLHLYPRGRRRYRPAVAAPAEGEVERDRNLAADRSAHAVGHRASRQRLARHHTRRLRIRDRGAGLYYRKPAGRLCDQRSGKNIRADR